MIRLEDVAALGPRSSARTARSFRSVARSAKSAVCWAYGSRLRRPYNIAPVVCFVTQFLFTSAAHHVSLAYKSC